MCSGSVTSEERVEKARIIGSITAFVTTIGFSPIASSISQKITTMIARPRYITATSFASAMTVARPCVANSQAITAKIAIGARLVIHLVILNIAAITASSTAIRGLLTVPTEASARPKRMAKTSVGMIFCSAIAATTLEGIMSMKNLIQSTDTARFCGTLPVAASGDLLQASGGAKRWPGQFWTQAKGVNNKFGKYNYPQLRRVNLLT